MFWNGQQQLNVFKEFVFGERFLDLRGETISALPGVGERPCGVSSSPMFFRVRE
jgi:hypothetical protein